MFDWATLAASGVSLIGSIAGIGATSNLNGRNRRFQSAEAEKAYERQKELYDTRTGIKAQMQQYRDSGINPNYVLQSGSVNGSSAPTTAQAETPQTFDYGSQISSSASRLGQLFQNGDLIRSQTNKNNAESGRINLLTPLELQKLGYDASSAKEFAKLAADNYKADLDLKNAEITLKQAQTATQNAMSEVYHWDALNKQFEFENIKPLELQQMQTSITKDLAQIDLLYAQKRLTEEEAKLAVANTYKAYMDAISNRISSQASMIGSNAQQQMADNQTALLPSQIDQNYSVSELNTSRSSNLNIDTDTRKKSQKFVLKSMELSNQLLGKDASWYNAKAIGGFIRDVGVGIGSSVNAVGSLIKP